MMASLAYSPNDVLPRNRFRKALPSGDNATTPLSVTPRHSFSSALVRIILLSLPALWLGSLMLRYAVDVPYGDQWDGFAPIFLKMQSDSVGFADLFRFHNEHRIFFPRLVMYPLAKLTHWNVRAEIGVMWVLGCLCAVNFYGLARTTGFQKKAGLTWLLLGAYLLLFTPQQWENLLWGFQIGFFLPLVTLTALPWAARALRPPINFAVTYALCLITTFSIASGFISWLLAAPLLWLSLVRRPCRRATLLWLIWGATAMVSVFIYFQGYKAPDRHPNQWEALQYPGLLCQFILAYLGNPFGGGTDVNLQTMSEIAGAILLLLLGGMAVYVWRRRKDRALVANALPWFSMASISLCSAVLTMFGRIGYGINGALQSRYISFAVILPIALIFLTALIAQDFRARNPRHREMVPVLCTGVATAFALLLLFNNIRASQYWGFFQHHRFTAKAVLALRDIIDEPDAIARYVHWNVDRVRKLGGVLEQIGYLRPVRLRSANVRDIADVADGVGQVRKGPTGGDGKMSARGWAILPLQQRIADSVILAYERPDGDPIIFARANVGNLREDVAAALNDSGYRNCGWEIAWRPDDVPGDAVQISAWAFDAELGRAYRIGSFPR